MNSCRTLLASNNIRCTEQRVAIYEALCASKEHPTADDLYHLARCRVNRLSLATVYNTLEVLCEAGLARRVPMSNGCCRYDGDVSDHLHIRFPATSEIRDVPEDLGRMLLDRFPREVVAEIERRLGVSIQGISVQFSARSNGAAAASHAPLGRITRPASGEARTA